MSEFQREARFFAELPVMPLREVVMLPRTIMPLFVGREASIKAIELAQSGYNKQMFLVAQREPDVEKPGADDLSPVGVVCKVLQMLRLPDGTIKVLFEGLHRARWTELREEDNCLMAMLCTVPESESRPEEREAMVRTVQEALEEYAKNNKKLTQEALMSIMALRDAGPLADAVVPHLKVDYRKKQEVLEIADVTERLERVYELLQGEVALASVEKRIKNRVKVQMERNQREYYLSEQLKAINKEMGREDDPQAEVDELEKKLEGRNMPQEARERCQSELRKLRSMPPSAAEYTVVRNYVDWLLDLPWNDLKEIDIDIEKARELDPSVQLDDEIGFPLKVTDLGRIAAQSAKQVIIQRMRDAEQELIYEEFKDRVGEICSGIIQRRDKGGWIINLGRTEAILPKEEQIPREHYKRGDRVQIGRAHV